MSEQTIEWSEIMCPNHFGGETACCKKASDLEAENTILREALENLRQVLKGDALLIVEDALTKTKGRE